MQVQLEMNVLIGRRPVNGQSQSNCLQRKLEMNVLIGRKPVNEEMRKVILKMAKILFVAYPKCTTCKKAENWLKEKGADYLLRDIKTDHPSALELKKWYEKSGLDIKRFFNTSGMLYKEMQLKDKLPNMSLQEKLDLLGTDGMLVKRPILVTDKQVLTGFKEKEWEEALKQ